MRIRLIAVLVATAAIGLTGCGSSSNNATGGTTPASTPTAAVTTPDATTGGAVAAALGGKCQDVANVSMQIAQAEAGMYTGAVDAMNTLASKLDGLKSDAPGNVKSAIDGLEAGFRQAAAVIANPTAQNQAKLRDLATQLKGDGQTVAAWVASECTK